MSSTQWTALFLGFGWLLFGGVLFAAEDELALFAMLWAIWPLVGVGLAVGIFLSVNMPFPAILVLLLFVGLHGILPISDRLTSRAHKGADQVLALNVSVHNRQAEEILKTLPNKGLDIIGLSEISTSSRQAWRQAFINRAYFVAMEVVNETETLLLASRYPIIQTRALADKQALLARIRRWDGEEVDIIVVHAQAPMNNRKLLRNLRVYNELSQLRPGQTVIVMGDFNTTSLSQKLSHLKHDLKLQYASSPLAGTWPAGFNLFGFYIGSLLPLLPLDHVLTRGVQVEAHKRVYFPGTDHLGQLITLRW